MNQWGGAAVKVMSERPGPAGSSPATVEDRRHDFAEGTLVLAHQARVIPLQMTSVSDQLLLLLALPVLLIKQIPSLLVIVALCSADTATATKDCVNRMTLIKRDVGPNFKFTMTPALFSTNETAWPLQYSAQSRDGSALPSCLYFDDHANVLLGSRCGSGTYDIEIDAVDRNKESSPLLLQLNVHGEKSDHDHRDNTGLWVGLTFAGIGLFLLGGISMMAASRWKGWYGTSQSEPSAPPHECEDQAEVAVGVVDTDAPATLVPTALAVGSVELRPSLLGKNS